VAAEDIAAQQPIEAGQVRVESREVSPRARAGLSSPEQAAGRLARRAISRGQVVSAELLSRRRDVERGDSVRLESEAGGARLEAEAKAETSGSAGDGILVRNLATGKRVRARVVRKGLVRVDAS
jgi:flagella basal body P-ring formation protein FlgA